MTTLFQTSSVEPSPEGRTKQRTRKNILKLVVSSAIAVATALRVVRPEKVDASGNCPLFCQGSFNFHCYFQQYPPLISSSGEGCGSGYNFYAFVDISGGSSTEGFISGGGLVSGCMTYDSSSCGIFTC